VSTQNTEEGVNFLDDIELKIVWCSAVFCCGESVAGIEYDRCSTDWPRCWSSRRNVQRCQCLL